MSARTAGTVKIVGSEGSFKVDARTGRRVTPDSRTPEEYRHIAKVDLPEFKQWRKEHKDLFGTEKFNEIDVVHISYWEADGKYVHESDDGWGRENTIHNLRELR
jgi:hypothetical protein